MAGHSPVPQDGKELRGSDLTMSDIAIKVENLGKSYFLGHNDKQAERYTALRDVIAHNAKNLARKTRDMFQGKAIIQGDEVEEFWALRDVSFDIKQGDRVGIIGRNGAGKSTLLKILSRITEPTKGRISINGRVASLLEVGTGFHPELTGQENIYLNGAILGMSRKEIQRKFDEIVAFAEVEKFLDTPVKRYSSGMYVRLAFAVAAHLEPEILIVDEVLAVGDSKFQKKCLGKMDDVSNEGRTVLFVSHNIDALKQLCNKGVLLSDGELIGYGDIENQIQSYTSTSTVNLYRSYSISNKKISIQEIKIDDAELKNGNLLIKIKYVANQVINNINPGIVISTITGTPVFSSNTKFHNKISKNKDGFKNEAIFLAKDMPLVEGIYSLSVWIGDNYTDYDNKLDAINFELKRKTDSKIKYSSQKRVGFIDTDCNWEIYI